MFPDVLQLAVPFLSLFLPSVTSNFQLLILEVSKTQGRKSWTEKPKLISGVISWKSCFIHGKINFRFPCNREEQ